MTPPTLSGLPDRFRVEEEIGRGGMSVVLRAHDAHLGRFVAIKVLSEAYSNAVGIERFEREIAVMAKLAHPGIVSLFDSGIAAGRLYYVMPLVPGESLRSLLAREGRLPCDQATALAADIADACSDATCGRTGNLQPNQPHARLTSGRGGFMTRTIVTLALAALAGTAGLGAQQAPPTWEQATFNTWKSLHDKILVMAKDTVFPDDKLGWKPHPDSRSVLDEYRHVTIGLEMSTALLAGQKFDYAARIKADDAKPKTRASVVAEMEAAMAASYAAVQKEAKPLLVFWIDHQAEHYGKLVSNYRMNNIVPPVSRPRGRGGV